MQVESLTPGQSVIIIRSASTNRREPSIAPCN
jgi:hypothetical protein